MTRRFQLAVAVSAVLVVGVVLIALATGVFDGPVASGPDLVAERDGPDGAGTGAAQLEGSGTADGDPETGPHLPRGATGRGALRPGMRDPHGLDLSDPQQAADYLSELLSTEPLNWKEINRVLGVMTEPLSDASRAILLQQLLHGQRNQAVQAFGKLQDGSLTEDLLAAFDDPANRVARGAILHALATMPGADPGTVAKELEARLTDDIAHDRVLLQWIGARGGEEAARVIVEYMARTDQPGALRGSLLRMLDLKGDPAAAAVVLQALKDSTSPQVTSQLLDMVAQAGATGFTKEIIALDADGQSDAIRRQALDALARIGGKEAIDHLLAKAEAPGTYGEAAVSSIRLIASADLEGRAALVDALKRAGMMSRPDETKENLLLALGRLKEKSAIPLIVKSLDDGNERVRIAAVRGLGKMKDASREHVESIVEQYANGSPSMKMTAAIALGDIGGKDAISAMDQMLSEEGISRSLTRTLNAALRFAREREAAGPSPAPAGPGLGERRESDQGR